MVFVQNPFSQKRWLYLVVAIYTQGLYVVVAIYTQDSWIFWENYQTWNLQQKNSTKGLARLAILPEFLYFFFWGGGGVEKHLSNAQNPYDIPLYWLINTVLIMAYEIIPI